MVIYLVYKLNNFDEIYLCIDLIYVQCRFKLKTDKQLSPCISICILLFMTDRYVK